MYIWKRLLLLLTGASAWSTRNGQIYDNNGSHYVIKGASYFGLEDSGICFHGLWKHPMDWYVRLMKDHGINTVRVPFSVDWLAYHFNDYPYDGAVSADPVNQHKKGIEILDNFFDQCEAAGINIMLDNHRNTNNYIGSLWYEGADGRYTTQKFFEAWYMLLDRYQDRPNLAFIDIKNEPHDIATWGSNDPSTDWRLFCIDFIGKITHRYPHNKWIFLVEGTGWGHYLGNALQAPVTMPPGFEDRLCYSDHSYGKSIVNSIDINNVQELRRGWDVSFGNVRRAGHCVITGEYGGRTDLDRNWMTNFVSYLKDINATDSLFWSLTPDSDDVKGLLLDDWTTFDPFKASLLDSLT